MSNITTALSDPLIEPLRGPDRVAYSLGRMLGVDDFADEQTYHRGRLARALLFLHGSGTVAGLRVRYRAKSATQPEEIVVGAGVAIDTAGRLVEVPREACIRLDAWWNDYAANRLSDLRLGLHGNAVIADVFLRFVACERGKTPAFVTGPFDALDAVKASRLRDGYELKLWVRTEADPPLPTARFQAQNGLTALQDAILDGWYDPADSTSSPLDSHALPADLRALAPHFVWLARLQIPAAAANPASGAPVRGADAVPQPDNQARLFSHPTGVLARLVAP